MNLSQSKTWSTEQSAQTYAIENWGDSYFSINNSGHVCVKPSSDKAIELDLFEIAQSLNDKNLSLPVLVRFTDILKDRVTRLSKAFEKACATNNYQGQYTPVYPIKVNQQRQVVEGILAVDSIGLEDGGKRELMAVMALSNKGVDV